MNTYPQKKLQNKYKSIMGELDKNRKDRAASEDLILNFLQALDSPSNPIPIPCVVLCEAPTVAACCYWHGILSPIAFSLAFSPMFISVIHALW